MPFKLSPFFGGSVRWLVDLVMMRLPMIKPVAPKPDCKAILICDTVIREEGTQKISLIGVFEQVRTVRLPTVHPVMTVYMKITGAEGTYQWRFELVRLRDSMVIGASDMQSTTHTDRLAFHQIILTMALIQLEQYGRHEIRIYGNELLIGMKTFEVIPFEQEENKT